MYGGCCSCVPDVPRSTCNLAQSVMITLPFTVGVYMTRMFVGPEGSEQQIGRMAGILVRRQNSA